MASVWGSRRLYDEFVLERIRSTLPECKSKCRINYFTYAIFPCSDFVLLNFVSADSRITSGRNQKFVSLLLISSSSRPNLLCFGFDLNQSKRTIPISRNWYLPDWKRKIILLLVVVCVLKFFTSELLVRFAYPSYKKTKCIRNNNYCCIFSSHHGIS